MIDYHNDTPQQLVANKNAKDTAAAVTGSTTEGPKEKIGDTASKRVGQEDRAAAAQQGEQVSGMEVRMT